MNSNHKDNQSNKPKIVVVGSANTDLVVQIPQFPQPGETILGHNFFQAQGGKGANQAVAAARLDAELTLAARLGRDAYGQATMGAMQAEGINVDHMVWDDEAPSGVAVIMVDASGENVIAVIPGANQNLCPDDVLAAEAAIAGADCVLMQLEIPRDTVRAAADVARRHNVPTILNPAPAKKLPYDLLRSVDILTPNETEAATLAGKYSSRMAKRTAHMLSTEGVKTIVMTLGADGALVVEPGKSKEVAAFPTTPVDTTGAGDAFNGALAVALARGDELTAAVQYANAVGALAVSKKGAQPSLPTQQEVGAFIAQKSSV